MTRWFAVRRDLPLGRQVLLMVMAFVLPVAAWSIVSYVPWIWHPQVLVTDAGGSTWIRSEQQVERRVFDEENARLIRDGRPALGGVPVNPVFLPAPHEVARAMVTAYQTPPRRGDKWLHEALWHSITIIAWGFFWSVVFGVPLGILCGTYAFFSRLVEPFIDFIRYMPAPAFGALMVAIFGIYDAPKVAIIFIGTFFQMVLVIANTTRRLDVSLLEAAQTLGANDRQLLTRVVVPGILPHLYTDLRVLLGWAWTYLIVAELIGASSGISHFISQQGKYRAYDHVFVGIMTIGIIGLVTDQVLGWIGRSLFPWHGTPPSRISTAIFRFVSFPIRAPWIFLGWVTSGRMDVLEAEASRRREREEAAHG